MYRRIVSSTSSFFPYNDDFIIPSTVEEIFMDYLGRRLGFFRAFFREKQDLCLYAHPNGSWELIVPNVIKKRPTKLPEPAVGINVSRDGMPRHDWLGLVAIHSDSWLLSIVSISSARLSPDERNCLFDMINDLPTLNEEVKKYHPKKASMQHPGSK